MQTVNMLQAKSTLSKLVEAIESGREEEVIIARNGRPAAKLVPVDDVVPGHRIAQSLSEPLRLLTHDTTVARYSDTVILV